MEGTKLCNCPTCLREKELLRQINEEHQKLALFPELVEALEIISKGKGRFSLDPLTHASNTIEDMKQIALEVLAKVKALQGRLEMADYIEYIKEQDKKKLALFDELVEALESVNKALPYELYGVMRDTLGVLAKAKALQEKGG